MTKTKSKTKERRKKRAKALLDRMRQLGPGDPPMAHRVKAELEKIAAEGYETEFSSQNSRRKSKSK